MRFIKGLKIDFNNGKGDIQLPYEFNGQTREFQASVIAGWIERLHMILRLVKARDHQLQSITGYSVEEILSKGHQIVFYRKADEFPCWCLMSVVKHRMGQHLFIWQATSMGSFSPIHSLNYKHRNLKTIRNYTKGLYNEWSDQISSTYASGPERVVIRGHELSIQQTEDQLSELSSIE